MFVEIARRLSHLAIHFVMIVDRAAAPRDEAAIATENPGHRFHLVGEVPDVRLRRSMTVRSSCPHDWMSTGCCVEARRWGFSLSPLQSEDCQFEAVDDGVNGFPLHTGNSRALRWKMAVCGSIGNCLFVMKQAARLSAEQNLLIHAIFSSERH